MLCTGVLLYISPQHGESVYTVEMSKWYKSELNVLLHLLSKLKKVREKLLILKIKLKSVSCHCRHHKKAKYSSKI